MGIRDWFKPRAEIKTQRYALNSPQLYEFMRGAGSMGAQEALRNSAVFRCVDLISGTMGMLPLYLKRKDANGRMVNDVESPLYPLLMFKPNGWQTAFEFKRLMQAWLLIHGDACARIVRTGNRVSSLIPMQPDRVKIKQRPDFVIEYHVTTAQGSAIVLQAEDVLHIRGLSLDGISGLSRVQQAADVIGTGVQAQRAADRIFRNGMIAGVALEHPGKLSPEALSNLKGQLDQNYAGADNAGRTMVLEEGMKRDFPPMNAQNAQLAEISAQTVESIARVFGVPRPLMYVDDTSWGSGIEQLAILFVRFGLAPWMKAWEEAIQCSLVPSRDWGVVIPDYDERELLRGTLKDQAEYFAKALGAGGHRPWMEANEVRDLSGLGRHNDGDGLVAAGETRNDASQAP